MPYIPELLKIIYVTMDEITTCRVCMKKVLDSEDGLQCDSACRHWFHIKCVGINKTEYSSFASNVNKKWYCMRVDCTAPDTSTSNTLLSKIDDLLSKFSSLATKAELSNINEGIQDIKADLIHLNQKIDSFEPRLLKLEEVVEGLQADRENVKTDSSFENMFEELNDRKRRACNVIVHGLKESKSTSSSVIRKHDLDLVEQIMKEAGLNIRAANTSCFRIGKNAKDKPRPLKICMPSESDAISMFRNFNPRNATDEALKDINLNRDRTLRERQHLFGLRETLKNRIETGDSDWTIKYINNIPKIVKKN